MMDEGFFMPGVEEGERAVNTVGRTGGQADRRTGGPGTNTKG